MGRKRSQVHYSFEGGEGDVQYQRRADSEIWIRTARKLRNVRILNGGGAARRPGLARGVESSGPVRLLEFISRAGDRRMLAFRPTAVDIYESDLTVEDTETSLPWAADDLATMQFATENDRVIVTSQQFLMRTLERSSAGAWTGASFSYDTGPESSKKQPYFRFSDTRGITLLPSGTSGSITVTASAALFVAGHVGTRFRILNREVEVTAYTDSTHVTATVIQALYPTMRWTVGSTTGFGVGDQVTTTADSVEGEVAAIVSATQIDVILKNGFTNPTVTSNVVVGPNTSSALSAVTTTTSLATTQWDEQMISSVRGYPGGCCFHRSRLVLYDFPQAPEYIAASAVGLYNDFDVGDGLDDDAIIEGIGDAPGKRIRHAISAEQLIVLGESGAYYVGDGSQSVLTPTTVDFLKIGPEPVGDANPVLAAEGVVYRETKADRIMLLQPTGTVRRSWNTTELADLSPHLVRNPTRLCIVDGCEWGPERYVFAVNDDGTLGCMHFRRGSEVVGWGLWETEGTFVDLGAFDTEVWAVALRDGIYTIEIFDTDRLTDESVLITNAEGDTPTDASWAGKEISLVWRTTEDGESRRAEVGYFGGTGAGALAGAPTAGRDYEGGRRFYTQVGLWPPIDPEAGPRSWIRCSRVAVDTVDSGLYYVDEKPRTPYRAADDLTQPPPLRSGWRALKRLGRERDPEVDVTQVESAPLTVRSVVLDAS